VKNLSAATSYLAATHLVLLIYGFIVGGCLLTAFSASWFEWLVTLALVFHLAKAELAAIPLASVWVTTIISIAAMQPWPTTIVAQHWALYLLLLWFLALLLIFLFASVRRSLQVFGLERFHSSTKLIIPVLIALGLGRALVWLF
jgi:hypothetical protein